jgi:hypothetical protein
MSERVCGDMGWRRAKLRETALWTRGDQVYDFRIGEVEREGHIDRMRWSPNRLSCANEHEYKGKERKGGRGTHKRSNTT